MFIALKRIIKFGWQGFWRAKGLSLQVIFIMFVAVFVVSFLFFFQQVSGFLISEAQKKVDISVYFKKGTSEARILEVKEKIAEMSEQVKKVEYVSESEAREIFVQKHQGDDLYLQALEQVEGNPFFASLDILAKTPDQYGYIASLLEEEPFASIVEKISYNRNKTVINKLFAVASNVQRVGLALTLFFSLLVGLITFNTIKLSILSSKRDISTKRLVGASNWFIRGPFVVQALLYASGAVLIFDVLFFVLVLFLSSQLGLLLLDFNLLNSVKENGLLLAALQFGFAALLAVGSACLSCRKYLKV